MNAVDPRTRSKVILDSSNVTARSIALPQLIVSNFLSVLALWATKDFLAVSDANLSWVVVRLLACGALAIVVWWSVTDQWSVKRSIEWPTVAFASLLQVIRIISLMAALVRLPYLRVAIITQFSSLWMNLLMRPPSRHHATVIVFGLLFSVLSSARFSYNELWDILPSYAALALEALSSSILEHTQGVLIPTLGHSFATGITILGAFVCHGTVYLLSRLFLGTEPAPLNMAITMTAIPIFALSALYLNPVLTRRMTISPSPQNAMVSYVVILASSSLFAILVFSQHLTKSDVLIAACLSYGMRPGQHYSPHDSPYASISQLARSYLKSILSNPESRKIFYFLVLNMCYMLVQMLYGIWTNSLGLISDAIHMAFDCMAIGVGLIASVMARWAPNERFTYGYGRIETLSGFSNGVFLILISIFIVFEAIERLMDPPDMNTSQLLLVSSLGLGVNLFGMFAMGGHHHHGGHSHGHSHGHVHSHAAHSRHSSEADKPSVHSHEHSSTLVHTHSTSDDECDIHTSHKHSHSHPEVHQHSHSASHQHTHSPSSTDLKRDESIVSHHEGSHDLPLLQGNSTSPVTPSYHFGHDPHFDEHHAHDHTPNLHDHSHVHSHAHEGHSHNMRGVFLHVMADTLGSVGVIISTLLIQFYGWTGFDPIASLFIAILIAASVIPLVIDTGKVLMLDLSDRASSVETALAELHHVEGLESHSSARFWPKDDNSVIGSIHVRVSPSASSFDSGGPHSAVQGRYAKVERVVERVDTLLRSRIAGLEELSIQVEGGYGDAAFL